MSEPAPVDATRARTAEERIAGRPLEMALLALVSSFCVGVTFAVLLSSVSLYFPADAAHYVGDADALMGHGVREIRHPLLFPAMLAALQPFVGDVGAFQIALGVAVFLLPVSLYFLLRQWLPPVASLAGAALGSLTPPVGELLGWGGGATLIGLDFMILSIASMERWIGMRDKEGLFVGVFAGLTALSHPFVFAATGFVLLTRWMFEAGARRSFNKGWGPLGLRGLASTLAIAGGLLLLSANYYLRLTTSTQGGSWNLGLPGSLLEWSTRENTFLLLFLLLGLLLPLPLARRSLMVVVASIAVLFLAIPIVAPWDISYSSRVVYFLPVLFGVGGGLLSHLALDQLRGSERLRRLEVPMLVALLLAAPVGTAFGLGYTQRLEVSSVYYQRVQAEDLPAFDYLRGGAGTVATSWMGAFQDQGSVNAWFVEALAKRPALGPGAPWLSTLATVGPAELDMQLLFSGATGLENGNLQISGTTTGGLRDPSVNVALGGYYYPLLYLNSFANGYPITVEEGVNVTNSGDALVDQHPAIRGGGEMVQESRLNASEVDITFNLVGGNLSAGPWDIWLWPAYYRPWDDVRSVAGGLDTTQSYRTGVVTTHVDALTANSSLSYYSADPRWGIQGIEVRANGTSSLAVRITVQGGDPVGTLRSFDEATLVADYGITDVLLWKDTGWQPRFDVSPRFHRSLETQDLIVYSVRS